MPAMPWRLAPDCTTVGPQQAHRPCSGGTEGRESSKNPRGGSENTVRVSANETPCLLAIRMGTGDVLSVELTSGIRGRGRRRQGQRANTRERAPLHGLIRAPTGGRVVFTAA